MKCENEIIGKYEKYGAEILFSTVLPSSIGPKISSHFNHLGQSWSSCKNIDYVKFKLFWLSILWKCSISTRNFFKEVNLGKHSENIRNMLLYDDPGNEFEYPFSIWTTVHDKSIPIDYGIQPRKIKSDCHTIYILPISGLIIGYYVSSHDKPKEVMDLTIKKNGTINIAHVSRNEFWGFVAAYLGKLK
jgi:hypothetical protein